MMSVFLKASALVVLFLGIGLVKAEENMPLNLAKETTVPTAPILPVEEQQGITLDEATKQVMQNTKNKVLAAKTEVIAGKKLM